MYKILAHKLEALVSRHCLAKLHERHSPSDQGRQQKEAPSSRANVCGKKEFRSLKSEDKHGRVAVGRVTRLGGLIGQL